jgi:hypothetical protein
VSSTTLEPGEEGTLLIGEEPHHGAGWHEFEIIVESNDPVEPAKKLYLSVDFYESGRD